MSMFCNIMSDILNYLKEKSRVIAKLAEDGPITLEDIFMPYCETVDKFNHVVELIKAFPQLETDALKLSNCILDDALPYDSLIGFTTADLETLLELVDYLDLIETPNAIVKCDHYDVDLINAISDKLKLVLRNGIEWNKCYSILAKSPGCVGRSSCQKDYEYQNIKRVGWDNILCDYLALIGDLRGLKWAHEKGILLAYGEIWTCENAAQMGYLECLEYAHTQGCKWNVYTTLAAAKNGHFACLKYALDEGCPIDPRACYYALLEKHFDCFRYAFDFRDKFTYRYCSKSWNDEMTRPAIKSENLEMLQHILDSGYSLSDCASLDAAEHKTDECLRYIHNLGCKQHGSTCNYAAWHGSLACLKFAHTHGYRWADKTCMDAIEYDNVDCLAYAVENGCPHDMNNLKAYAIEKKSKKCITYLGGLA